MFGGGFDDGTGGGFGGADTQFGGGQFGGNFGGDQYGVNMSQNGGGFEINNSGPDAKSKNLNKQSLMPCTIKQLMNAPTSSNGDNSFTIDNQDLHQVTIVGLITQADEQNTNLQYTIDDGTGTLTVKMWIDANNDEANAEKRAHWREGVIVRVIGQMRAFNQVRSIVAFHIQPLQDMNEYTFHFVECVHTHLRNTKGRPQDQGAPTGAAGMGGAYAPGMGAPGMGAPGMGAPGMAPGGAAMSAAAPMINGMTPLQDTVLKYFSSYGADNDVGCTIADCASAMAAQNHSLESVRGAVDFLVNDGHLYSTIDDEHYKATS